MKLPTALFLLAAGTDVPAATPPTGPIQDFHTGEILQPACIPGELARLKAASDRLTKAIDPQGAWGIARAMLCSNRAPTGRMPRLVSVERYGLDEDSGAALALVDRRHVEPLRGLAYGASVEASGHDLSYHYNTAGVCVGGFTLRLADGRWLLVRLGEACD